MANSNGSGKFALGVLFGAVLGAVAVYLSDKNRRDTIVDNISSTVDRTRDSLVEGYYEAKNRYNEYRERISSGTDRLIAEVREELEDLD